MKQNKAAELAATKLSAEELRFADLVLTQEKHGYSKSECYALAGFPALKTKDATGKRARKILEKKHVVAYMTAMNRESIRSTGLTLAYLDGELDSMIRESKTAWPAIYEGSKNLLKFKDLSEIPENVRALIQEIRPTKWGYAIKLYSRHDLMRTAYQRFGALTDKHMLVGEDGGPVATRSMDKDEYAETRQKMLEQDDV